MTGAAIPSFHVEGGLLLACARGLSVAALLSAFGGLLFQVFVADRAIQGGPAGLAVHRRLHRLTRTSLFACGADLLLWLVMQAAELVGAGSPDHVLHALPVVLTGTMFGRLIALQLLAVLAGVAALGRGASKGRRSIALGCVAIATALQAGHGHAAAMMDGPRWLLAADILHLCGAGGWLGGLLPLLVVIRHATLKEAASAARWFSPVGKWCVAALAVSALLQSRVLIATLPGLIGTPYGWVALVKLALLAALLGFAAANRHRFAPALLQDQPERARRMLIRSIALQTGVGLAAIAAAIILTSLPPAMHTQPIWPFAHRFTLETIGEDPDFRREALGAATALGGALLLLISALVLRRTRWLAVVGAGAIAWFAVPHLDLLFVPAYPTSFYRSPTGFAAFGIGRGAALFSQHCAMCHGDAGQGNGAMARGLPVPPADLTAGHLWMHRDGELFWWLSHGIETPDGQPAMPGFAGTLSEDDRWRLIDYVRAHNAGWAYRMTGHWPVPLQAPDLQARCQGDGLTSLAGLRPGFVRLRFSAIRPPIVAGVTTVLVTADPAIRPGAGFCVANDPALEQAYEIVTGLPSADMPGTQILIDGQGWLRAMQRGDVTPGWNDPAILADAVHRLQISPMAMPQEDGDPHMRM